MNNCPKCNTAVNDADSECPSCGIFFSKWKEREDNVASGNVSRYSAIANATSSSFNWTILIIVCVVIVGLMYFIGHRINE